jgi:hypothetical protein
VAVAANLDLSLALVAFSGEGSFRATTTAIRDLCLYGLIRRTGTNVPQWDSNQGRKDHRSTIIGELDEKHFKFMVNVLSTTDLASSETDTDVHYVPKDGRSEINATDF